MESFYGGRKGQSINIVHTFDGIDIEADSVYGVLWVACDANEQIIYDSSGNYIYRSADNYYDYQWTTISSGEYVEEGMEQCFERGGSSTDIVNYGEYCLIDTITNLGELNNPDNGKIFRRNFDNTAELIGQIVGPQGGSGQVGFNTFAALSTVASAATGTYDTSEGLAPGYDSTTDTYIDGISYAVVNVQNSAGISTMYMGFRFPYLVNDFTSQWISPYDEDGALISTATALLSETDDGSHPYYKSYRLSIPQGVKGNSALNLSTYSDANGYTRLYYTDTDYTNSSTGVGTTVDIGAYNQISGMSLSQGVLTVSYTGAAPSTMEVPYVAGICLEDDGTWTFYDAFGSTIANATTSSTILWPTNLEIETVSASGSTATDWDTGDQKVHVTWNDGSTSVTGSPINYIIDTKIVTSEDVASTAAYPINASVGSLLVYYSDPSYRNALPSSVTVGAYSDVLGKYCSQWQNYGDITGSQGVWSVIRILSDSEHTDILSGGSSYSTPPETIENNNDMEGRGYAWLDSSDNTYYLYFFAYDASNPHWFACGSLASGSVSIEAENIFWIGSSQNSNLEDYGVWGKSSTMRYAGI